MLISHSVPPCSQAYFILGTTASGKSGLALKMAKSYSVSVVNADGMQALDALPILTASPSQEEKQTCPHFLYNYSGFSQKYLPDLWLKDLKADWNKIISNARLPLLVGGYKSYFLLSRKYFVSDFSSNLKPILICPPKETRDSLIRQRASKMLTEGLLEEGAVFFGRELREYFKYGISQAVGFNLLKKVVLDQITIEYFLNALTQETIEFADKQAEAIKNLAKKISLKVFTSSAEALDSLQEQINNPES